jgi:hypothetical protein
MGDIVPNPRHVGEFVGTRLADLAGPKDRSLATGKPGVEGDASFARLVEIATNDDSLGERAKAVAELGYRRDPAALPCLLRLADDASEDDTIRAAAARALARVGTQLALPPLRTMATSGSSTIRRAAAEGLGVLNDRDAVPALIALLEHPTVRVRDEAATALGAIGDPRAVPALTRALDDPAIFVRVPAREALTSIASDDAIEALDRNPRRRLARKIDVRQASRARRWREARPVTEQPGPLHRVVWLKVGGAVFWVAIVAFLIACDLFFAGANPLVAGVVAAVGFGIGRIGVQNREDEFSWGNRTLDSARARAASAAQPRVRHPLVSVALNATDLRLSMVLFVIPLTIAIDVITGGVLVTASLLAGFCANM